MISVYPNPVSNGIINLHFANEPEGIYTIRLLNKTGQVMISKEINHVRGSNAELIELDKYIGDGIYQMEISKPDGIQTSINVAVMK